MLSVNMKNTDYWLDKIGISGILLGPAETATSLAVSGKYLGPGQLDEGVGILTGGLAAWNAAKYVKEHKEGRKRSPLVHAGRAMEVGGAAVTEGLLLSGNSDNVYRAFLPAALGVTVGPVLEYVAGPIHEKFSRKYRTLED
jgi:hypothetical protein